MYFLGLISLASSLETNSCAQFACSNGPTRLNCIEQTDSNLLLSPCVVGLLCDTASLNSITPTWTTVKCIEDSIVLDLCEDYKSDLYTGEACCVSSNCKSSQCTNDRCEGVEEGGDCSEDEECIAGFYCDGSCKAYVTGTCIRDNMCEAGFGCNYGNCVQLYSLAVGVIAEKNFFCQTGYVYNGLCDAIDAYVGNTKLGETRECTLSATCKYITVNGKETIEESLCMCAGISGGTTGYCGLYANKSLAMIDFYNAIKYTSSECSGSFAHTDNIDTLYSCGAIDVKSYNYSKIMIDRYEYFGLYQSGSVDHCTRPLDLFDPWYDPTTYSGSEILAILFFHVVYIS